tara:strand:+ start:1535 stop:1801 length:267 start_codon:yes stop_codon:yes gene_type:complete
MSNGRPSLGYSNLYWTKKITREQRQSVSIEEEILEEPIALETLEEKVFSNIDRIEISKLSDTFCPPRLTKLSQSDKLYTSPQQGEPNE